MPNDYAELVWHTYVPEELAAALGGLPAGSSEPPGEEAPSAAAEAAAKAAATLFGEATGARGTMTGTAQPRTAAREPWRPACGGS